MPLQPEMDTTSEERNFKFWISRQGAWGASLLSSKTEIYHLHFQHHQVASQLEFSKRLCLKWRFTGAVASLSSFLIEAKEQEKNIVKFTWQAQPAKQLTLYNK